jgi:leukotriene-A4 hydrolase
MKLLVSLARSLTSFTLSSQVSAAKPALGNFFRKMTTTAPIPRTRTPRDPNTLSNYHNWITKHTKADFAIDFKAQKLSGTVTLQLESLTPGESNTIILDTSFLDISSISIDGAKVKEGDWEVADRFEPYGSPLTVQVPGGKPKSEIVELEIQLSTTDKCTALQWLTPAQTKSDDPYMFSQCQAIHARSLFPCQDTPDVKSTYDFYIRSPLPVIASGVPVPEDKKVFDQFKKLNYWPLLINLGP